MGGTMGTTKQQCNQEMIAYDEVIARAESDLRNPDGMEMIQKCPYIYGSNAADIYWITAHALYHT
jgi:hypothetical protein